MKSILKFIVLSAFFISISSCEKEEGFESNTPELIPQSQDGKLKVYEVGDTFVINEKNISEQKPIFFLSLKNNLPNTLEWIALNGQEINRLDSEGNVIEPLTVAPGETLNRFFNGLGSNPAPGILNQDITFKYTVDGFDNYISFGGFIDISDEDNTVLKVNASHSNNFEDAVNSFGRFNSDSTALIYSPYTGSGLSDRISSKITRSNLFIPGTNEVLFDLDVSVSRD
ncbi:hypothetical protein ABW636_20905 [Aquimarina sp. 2201CG1-2-11]|uniref:hypothetical protein n=1 Tax=Aquimarina discodermiae TaxID=3231043 RepID=UPI00346338FF